MIAEKENTETMKLPILSLLLCYLIAVSSLSLQPALSAVNAAFEYNPYAAGALVAGFKAGSADILAQKRQIRKFTKIEDGPKDESVEASETNSMELDIRRTLAFLLYGAIYQGFVQEFTYNHLYPMMFGTETTTITVLKKVFCDMCIQTPLFTLPIAYYSKALLAKNTFKEAMERYVDDVKNKGLLFKFWGLWTPVQCLTFSVIPEHFRVSFIALVSFFWVIILSSLSSTPTSSSDASTAEVNGKNQKTE